MKEFKYDVVQLLHCVKDRPCLWDKTIENYKDRIERRLAWKEIFCLLEESYEAMTPEEKRFTEETIIGKWTNVRDTFMKTLKTRMGRPKKKYLLYNHIKFLTKIVPEEERLTEYNNEDDVLMKQEVEIELDSSSPAEEPSYSKKRSKRNDFDDDKSASDYSASEVSFNSPKRKTKRFTRGANDSKDTTKRKTRKIHEKDESEKVIVDNVSTNEIDFVEVADNDPRIMNEDEAFFASLLPSVVKYNEDERLEFRIEVLGVMKKIKEKRQWVLG